MIGKSYKRRTMKSSNANETPSAIGTGFMETFKQKLNEIRKVIDGDRSRSRVLALCQQSEPSSFDEYSSRKLEKFESSTYSEVLKAVNLEDNNRPVVMKIMRALSKGVIKRMPSSTTKGCQSYNDILNELVIIQALSQLHTGVLIDGKPNLLYKTHFFCFIHEIKVVSGSLERTLSRSRTQTVSATSFVTNSSEPLHQQQAITEDNSPNGKASIETTGTAMKNNLDLDMNNKLSVINGVMASQNKADYNGKQNKKLEKPTEPNPDLTEDDRMLMEALPFEYVVSVMKHDGQPLWHHMTNKKLTPDQLTSVMVQVIVGLAIAERVYLYEHRDLHVSNILIKKTSKATIPFVLDGIQYNIISHGIKATIIDATFSRLTHNGKVYFRDLTSTLRAYGTRKPPPKMSIQNRSYREMVHVTRNNWEDFNPKTNLIWLTYLCETLMKDETMRANEKLSTEIRKIRDYTLKVETTLQLLGYFPFTKERPSSPPNAISHTNAKSFQKNMKKQQSSTVSNGTGSISDRLSPTTNENKPLHSSQRDTVNGKRTKLNLEKKAHD